MVLGRCGEGLRRWRWERLAQVAVDRTKMTQVAVALQAGNSQRFIPTNLPARPDLELKAPQHLKLCHRLGTNCLNWSL